MADTTVVVEGKIKFRDGKKWKPRWCVMKKPSPVADRLQVLLYKDVREAIRDGGKPKSVFPLEGFYGIESMSYDKEVNVMALVCHKQVTLLAFESKDTMIQFEVKIRKSLGQEHQFPVRMVKVPNNSRVPLDLVRMHIHGQKFCLTAYIPPKILQSWQVSDLRRFGSVEGKFCFEGGSKCGRGTGIHVALSDQAQDISEVVQLASQGKLSSCNPNVNKRSSQIPAAFDSVGSPFGSSSHHVLPPSVLGCCGDMQNQDDWGWQKRHSISVMDYRRIGALAEKSRLLSIENVERRRLMAIYDVPPKRIRKVEVDNFAKPLLCSSSEKDSAMSSVKVNGSGMSHLSVHGSSAASLSSESTSSSLSGIPGAQSAKDLFRLQTTGDFHGYSKSLGNQGNYQLSVIEDEIRSANDRTKRKEALQKLQREESSLQREITLLDEILQVCKFEDDGKPKGTKDVNLREKSSSLPLKNRKDLRVDTKLSNRESSQPSIVHKSVEQRNIDSCLSPNLLSKLKEIPSHSKLLAPLPYVNLSKYDEDDKSNHVHVSGSGDKLVTSSGCSNSLSNVAATFNKENSPQTQAVKLRLGARSSSESRIAAKSNELAPHWKREPIYANEVSKKEDTPPPELPPKGPALLRKNLSRTSTVVPPPPPSYGISLTPPPLPARDRSRSVGSQGKQHGYDNAPACGYQSPRSLSNAISSPQDTYLLMGGFKEEPKSASDAHYSSGGGSFISCRSIQGKLLEAGATSSNSSSQYMEMAGQFEPEATKLRISDSSSSESDLYGYGSSPKPSIELKITEPIDESPPYLRQLPPESNYMEMTGLQSNRNSQVLQNLQTLQSYVSSTPGGNNSQSSAKSDAARLAMPFPNLLNFQKRQTDIKKTPPKPNNDNGNQNGDPPQEPPKEGGGFLARFMRRNSRDQKAASQSQENLLGGRSRSSFLERSQSDQGEAPKPELPETVSHLKVGRQRSSSFPNRLSFQEANPEPKPSNETKVEHQPNIETKSVSPGDLPPPLPPERNKAREYRGSRSLSLDDRPPPPPPELQTDNRHVLKRNVTDPVLKEESKREIRVLTVLHVQQEFPVVNPYFSLGDSSKTDDEKMIELLQYGGGGSKFGQEGKADCSSVSDLKANMKLPLPPKSLSANEQAAEIARHVTSLPPFIPPKTKPYPSTLSPVVEAKLSPKGLDSESIYVEMKELPHSSAPSLDPASQKDKARATLRICPPVEDEDGKIWVPRDSLNSPDAGNTSSQSAKSCDTDNLQYSTLVVSVDDLNDRLDAISVSSHESSETNSIRSEEALRSSPASTILRPRSGKDYQVIERRRTTSGSCPSSPRTPYSPSTGTVFSFESNVSNMSSRIEEPNRYMNVDMSGKHICEHEVSPERTFREKLLSEREKRSCERTRLKSERSLERHKLHSEKEYSVSPATCEADKKEVSPLRDKVSPERDKQFLCKEDVLEIDGVSCDSHDTRTVREDSRVDIEIDAAGGAAGDLSPELCSGTSPPLSPHVPMSPIPPEQIYPELNYAEIDLSTASSPPPPPVEPVSKWRHKKMVPNTPIAYATIDMMATNAVKQAGIEHAQSREDSLRRSVSMVHKKNSAMSSVRERKFSMRERKTSTDSLDD